jgi:hypothetical protein
MIPTHEITFQVRSYGRFKLTPASLEFLEPVDPRFEDTDLAKDLAPRIFARLDSNHITTLEAMDRMSDAFMVDPDAITIREAKELPPLPPVPEGSIA